MIITRDKNKSHQTINRLITDTIQSDNIQVDEVSSGSIINSGNISTTGNLSGGSVNALGSISSDTMNTNQISTPIITSPSDITFSKNCRGITHKGDFTILNETNRFLSFVVPASGDSINPFVLSTANKIAFEIDAQDATMTLDENQVEINRVVNVRGSAQSIYVYGDNNRSLRLHCASEAQGYFDLSGYKTFNFRNNGQISIAHRARIEENGDYTKLSDDRLKEEEFYIENGLETICKIKPETYLKKDAMDSTDTDKWRFEGGVIAQQIWYQVPELRHLVRTEGTPDENIEIPDEPTQDPDYSSWGEQPASVCYEGFIPYLISAIKELKAEIDTLKNGI